MKIKTKLQLNTVSILVLFLLHLGFTFTYFSRISDQLHTLIVFEAIEESLFELEINLSEHAGAVLLYLGFPNQATLNRIEDSQADLERHVREFVAITQAEAPKWFSEKIVNLDQQQAEIGDSIVSLVQRRNVLLAQLQVSFNSIDEILDDEFQASIQVADPDFAAKQRAALDMEVNVDEAFAAVEGYVLDAIPELKLQVEDAKNDFANFVALYRDTTTTTAEETLLNTIERDFFVAMEGGEKIINLTDWLKATIIDFEMQLDQVDYILDEELQIFIHEDIQERSRVIENSIRIIALTLIIFTIVVTLILTSMGSIISKGIIDSVTKLAEGLRHFSHGNLDYQISTKSGDELDLLAGNLNEMASHLKDTTISRNALVKEIAERKSVERELESSRARFAGILDIAQEAIISINEEQQIVIFNKGAEVVFGYTEAEALGKHLDILIPEKVRTDHRQYIDSFTESDSNTRLMGDRRDLLGLHKNGSVFPIEATISKLLSNGVLILTVILRDITQRKQVEQQLKNHSLLLEQAVEKKTREMLSLSERMARHDKLVTIGKIAGNIAHELRNPLGVINQSVFYLSRLISRGQNETFNDKAASSLALMETELNAANTVISNLLDATRTKEIELQPTDLEKLTRDIANGNMLTHKLNINFELEPAPFIVMVDPDQFRQVISNLLINAMQANAHDLRVTVKASIQVDDNVACIKIEDNGPGMEADTLEKVFEPLYTTRDMGTGLGLSICQQIIAAHAGSININSMPGQGTIVEILIPMEKLAVQH